MNYLMFAIILLLLASGVASAEDRPVPLPTPQVRGADAMTACPHSGAEAIVNVDKSLGRGPVAQRVTLLCLAEVVRNLQARVKELEAAKAK
jgi:hypothetical protein